MNNSVAEYEGCYGIEQVTIELPPDRKAPERVASYLRLGGRITDRALMSFKWNGQMFSPMVQRIVEAQ